MCLGFLFQPHLFEMGTANQGRGSSDHNSETVENFFLVLSFFFFEPDSSLLRLSSYVRI